MRRGAKFTLFARQLTGRRHGFFPQPGPHLDPQDTRHGIVNAAHRDLLARHAIEQALAKLHPVLARRDHEDVDPGQHRRQAAPHGATGDLAVTIPVRDHQTIKAHLALEHIGQQIAAAMQLAVVLGPVLWQHIAIKLIVPTVERRHDHLGAGIQPREVAHGVQVAQIGFRIEVLAPVDPVLGSAVPHKMLHVRDDMALAAQIRRRPLQAAHHRAGIVIDNGGIFGIALIGPAPAIIPGHRDRRGKGPVQPGGGHFPRRHLTDTVDEPRIPRRSQADVVREQGRREDIVVAVHRIGRPHEGDAIAPALKARLRRQPVGVGLTCPVRCRRVFVIAGPATAPIEDRANLVARYLLWRHFTKVGLDHLADLLFQRHPGEQSLDLALHPLILGNGTVDLRPGGKIGHGRQLIGHPGTPDTAPYE
ncbi:hypothetical protein D3C84_623650 [compost metagenome]